jgi:hypothetical protein
MHTKIDSELQRRPDLEITGDMNSVAKLIKKKFECTLVREIALECPDRRHMVAKVFLPLGNKQSSTWNSCTTIWGRSQDKY